jgi:hypothetical protein
MYVMKNLPKTKKEDEQVLLRLKERKPVTIPIFVTIVFVTIGLLANIFLSPRTVITNTRSKAAEDAAIFTLYPTAPSMPPNSTVGLMVDAKTHKIGFIMTEFTFDPTKIHLASDITVNDKFQTVLEKSTPDDANATGKIDIAMVLFDPTTSDTPPDAPTGVFEVARMTFQTRTEAVNDDTSLEMVPYATQIGDMENTNALLPFLTTRVNFSLNPVVPSLTPTPAISETPVPPSPTSDDNNSSESATIIPSINIPQPTATNPPQPTITLVPTVASSPTPTPILVIPTNEPTQTPTPMSNPTATSMINPTPTPVSPGQSRPIHPGRRPTPTPKSSIGRFGSYIPLSPTPKLPSTVNLNTSELPTLQILGDLDRNGCTNAWDMMILLRQIAIFTRDPRYDLNNDQKVNTLDLIPFFKYLGFGCRRK